MLDDATIESYLAPLLPEQVECIRLIRSFVVEICPTLDEAIDTGKWFGGLLTYTAPDGMFCYALGPRSAGKTTFHMMPYYGSKELQERHGAAFKKVLSGKSCILFKTVAEIPQDAIRDMLSSTPKFLVLAKELYGNRKKK